MNEPSERLHILVSGLVQGVFFRAATRARADQLGLTGLVRNLADGRVEIVAEGPRDKLEALSAWARRGPPGSRVEEATVTWKKATGEYASFAISSEY